MKRALIGAAVMLLGRIRIAGGGFSAQRQKSFEQFAPVVSNCKTIRKEYTDLFLAPAELVKDKDSYLPPLHLV